MVCSKISTWSVQYSCFSHCSLVLIRTLDTIKCRPISSSVSSGNLISKANLLYLWELTSKTIFGKYIRIWASNKIFHFHSWFKNWDHVPIICIHTWLLIMKIMWPWFTFQILYWLIVLYCVNSYYSGEQRGRNQDSWLILLEPKHIHIQRTLQKWNNLPPSFHILQAVILNKQVPSSALSRHHTILNRLLVMIC